MTGDDSHGPEPTRRRYLKYGGAVAAGGLLAGCAGGSTESLTTGSADTDASGDRTATTTTTSTETETTTDDEADGGSYSVSMAPVGEVEFDAVPERALTYYPVSADATVAFGHGDAITGIGYDKELFGNTVDYYYDALDGVDFEWEDLGRVTPASNPNALDRELFYELDSDVHFLDPALLRSSSFDWTEDEVASIASDVGPWFGNYYSRTNAEPPEPYRDRYEYYTLWEYLGYIAAVFREEARYRAFKSIRDDLVARIQADLPPASERPSLAVVAYTGGTFWPYDFTQDGYLWAHLRPFGMPNAFAATDAETGSGGSYDYEAMVETAPDVVLRYWGTALGDSFRSNREEVLSDPLADEVPAFRDGRYFPSGNGMQGPIMNLFQLEMTAKQLFPDRFGAWPGYGDGESYPEIPAGERLFNRGRVADVVTGEF
ncbi:ABC transporter substrate-binding protein [Haloferax massiliensis]|uniref:Periplasmic binding protein n=1 Tax=Haloferax massiliensis TaxID=1476858 RepID=A0A0D6JV91_9EURY|nr:ABC transporter substrate-binding protein [Haloferax massiliensis]CQR52776.1 Periplasmic binding protein [Haloferax massiliensis]